MITLPNASLCLLLILVSRIGTAIEVREPENETEVPALGLSATESSINGPAVGEAPDISVTSTAESTLLKEIKDALDNGSPLVDAVFPDNHKNFTASTYLGAIESPQSLQAYNKYQQQYKEYYDQKQQYASASKPIKFEQNNANIRFVGAESGVAEDGQQNDVHVRNKPYPYLFENSQVIGDAQEAYPIPDNDKHEPSGTSLGALNFLQGSPLGNLFGHHGSKEHITHHGHRSEVEKHEKHGSKNGWGGVMKMMSMFLPLGLFLATLTPNVLYINTTETSKPSRVRSLNDGDFSAGDADPLVKLVEAFGGLEAMDDPMCEDRFFCEMSRLGLNDTSTLIEKGFWYLANNTPDDVAQEVGMKELFDAIRTDSCEMYDCQQKNRSAANRSEIPLDEPKKKKPKKIKKIIRT